MTDTGGWLPVGLSDALASGTVRGTTVQGREVALWREDSGTAHAWPDRCPHRGMRLSFGCVRDGLLACLYHGFRFDAEGLCRHVPADPDFSPSASLSVTPLPCAEQAGFIWVAGDAGASDAQPPAAGVEDVFRDVASLDVAVPAAVATGALADHRWLPASALTGTGPDAARPLEATAGGGTVTWRLADGATLTCDYAVEAAGPNLHIVEARCDAGRERLAVAVQPLDGQRSMLHVRAAGDEDAARHQLRVAVDLRRAIEASAGVAS